jgi:hypothetical protein
VAADAADVVAAAFAQAGRRDPHHERTWIALADGNKDQIRQIQAQAAARGITVTIVIDFIHVTEYLQDAVWCLFPDQGDCAGGEGRRRRSHGPADDRADGDGDREVERTELGQRAPFSKPQADDGHCGHQDSLDRHPGEKVRSADQFQQPHHPF